jgi:hypothetical protein
MLAFVRRGHRSAAVQQSGSTKYLDKMSGGALNQKALHRLPELNIGELEGEPRWRIRGSIFRRTSIISFRHRLPSRRE